MADLIYYVASSVDGFIADKDGGIGWLDSINAVGEDFGYHDFYASMDSLIIGRTTYEQALGFGDWVYAGKPCWVMTSQPLKTDRDDLFITSETPKHVLQNIRAAGQQNTWLIGGGKLAKAFYDEGLITEFIISIIPYILGDGIPLMAFGGQESQLELVTSHTYQSGLVQVTYRPKK